MKHMIILLAVFTFGLNAARVASEWQEENALDRLSTAIDSDKKVEALKILNDEHDSLRSTQEGANLAIKACAIYGDVKLYSSFMNPVPPNGFCCVQSVGSTFRTPNDEGIQAAYIEAAKYQGGINFLEKISLLADSQKRKIIYIKIFEELAKKETINTHSNVLLYLADHLKKEDICFDTQKFLLTEDKDLAAKLGLCRRPNQSYYPGIEDSYDAENPHTM